MNMKLESTKQYNIYYVAGEVLIKIKKKKIDGTPERIWKNAREMAGEVALLLGDHVH